MRCNALLIFGLFALPAVGYSQNQQLAAYQDLITVSTQAPDAASIGKFGNIPVNYNTGATSISIPIFEINVGKTKIPISLDYHSAGIRVDETASSVGIGWALNGIGEVGRNVVGLPDEGVDGFIGYLQSPPFDSLYNDWASGGGLYGTTIDQTYAGFLNAYRQGSAETEPDIYSYTLNGSSGKFILRKDGTFMQFPLTNNVISQITGGFKIVDPAGTVYIFNQMEHTTIISGGIYKTYTGRWRLAEIIDPNTVDTILFHYASACDVNVENYYNYTYSLGYGPDCVNNASPNAINYQGENFTITTIEHTDEEFPSEIDWRGGKITFQNSCDRLDKESEQRINSIDVYAAGKNGYQLTKAVQLYQSYFYSDLTGDSAHDERNYRLRLDSVSYIPLDAISQPETYRMTYNTAVAMASRESMAQDQWGFNNGQFSNPTPMPKQLVTYDAVNYNIGEANRNPDSLSMLSCSIQSIQYPTGGKSVFEFEPHLYLTNTDSTAPKNVPCPAYGSVQTTTQATFTPDSNGSAYSITYSFTSYNYTDVTGRPNVTVTDQTTGEQVMFISSSINPSESINNYSSPSSWYPTLGHTYLIVTNIYTTTDINVNAQFTISWIDTYNVNQIDLAGGLRVKSVTNYDATGAFISRDIYKYGVGESGMGNLVTPSTYLLVNSETITYKCGALASSQGGNLGCQQVVGNPAITYYANPVYPASQFSGSTILYPEVTKYQVDSFGNPNGKSIFEYSVYDDQPAFASTNYSKVGVMLITDLWRNGYLGYQLDYKYNSSANSYQLIHQKFNNYGAARQQTLSGLDLHNNYNWNTSQCYLESMANAIGDYLLVQIPVNSGAMLLQSTSDSTYDDAGHVVGSTVSYSYNDTTHLFPTSEVKIDSKGNPRMTNLKYPHDFSATTPVYANMLSRNIISPVIQTLETYSGVQTRLQNVNYADWFGNQTLFEPSTVQEQIGSFPLETRVQFNSFDKYGNILQQQKVSDMNQSYVWDYTSNYPIATVKNAQQSDIAYTSFEADGTGNWTIGAGTVDQTTAITGTNSYSLNSGSTISASGLNSSTTYIVSYWSHSGPFNIAGTISGYPVTGKTEIMGGFSWTLYVHKVTGQSTISLTGSGLIDELRLYPSTAQMTTYTYSPLVGMTSQTDVGNRVTYYEYDGLARLKRIRDQDYNILKTYEYQYQVPAGCNGCQSVAMETFLGTNTIGYPVGVFDIHGNLVGNAAGASAYVSLWNSDTADERIGTLSTGNDSLHFNIVLHAGQTLPASVTGCRYYQYDLPWTQLDGVRNFNGTYVDFGDGTGMHLAAQQQDTPRVIAPYTTYTTLRAFDYYHRVYFYQVYLIHNYPNDSIKTITFYHNDANENSDLDNAYNPATSLLKLTNLRGNLPQNTNEIGGSCYQQPGALTVSGISNWNSITSVHSFNLQVGDLINGVNHVSYAQDFMQNNRGLDSITTQGCTDTTFKLSLLKSNWNTWFTNLFDLEIIDNQWNREDISALTNLWFFKFYSTSTDSLGANGIPEIDNIINQIAAGAGKYRNNGIINITWPGFDRTNASLNAYQFLKPKGWTIYINGVNE
jgi:YD repeat-containing protein